MSSRLLFVCVGVNSGRLQQSKEPLVFQRRHKNFGHFRGFDKRQSNFINNNQVQDQCKITYTEQSRTLIVYVSAV